MADIVNTRWVLARVKSPHFLFLWRSCNEASECQSSFRCPTARTMAIIMRKGACMDCACPDGWMNLGVTQASSRWGPLCSPCGGPVLDMRSGKRGQPRDPTPEGDRMLLNTYLERDKHQDGQCSCTPTARCRSFHRLTEHMIKAHSEALTRMWLDWLFQESLVWLQESLFLQELLSVCGIIGVCWDPLVC